MLFLYVSLSTMKNAIFSYDEDSEADIKVTDNNAKLKFHYLPVINEACFLLILRGKYNNIMIRNQRRG